MGVRPHWLLCHTPDLLFFAAMRNPAVRRVLQLAVPAASLFASRAAAQVIYSPVSSSTGADANQSLFLDFGDGLGGTGQLHSDGFATQDFKISFDSQNLSKPRIAGSSPTDGHSNLMATAGDNAYAVNFAAGTLIDASQAYSGSSNLNYNDDSGSSWTAGTHGYVGVSFFDDADTPQKHYGWISLTYGSDRSLSIDGFAYEQTPGAGILAGSTGAAAVPEPASYALGAAVLAGSAALFLRRRQRTPAA